MHRMLLIVLLALTACSSGQAADDASSAGTPAAPEPTVAASPVPSEPLAPDPSAAATTGLGDASAAPDAFEGSTETTSTPGFPDADVQGVAYLTGVRVGRHPGFDRVVWEFDGDLPAYRIDYVQRPITEDGSGEPIEVSGDAVLQIILTPASGTDLSGEELRPVYQGPERIDAAQAGATVVQELVQTGDFEATLSWAVGVGRQAPFAVTELSDPTRVVIDIASR